MKRSPPHKMSATMEEAEAESSTAHHKKGAGPPHERHAPKHQTDISQERGPAGRKARTAARRENPRSRTRRQQRPRSPQQQTSGDRASETSAEKHTRQSRVGRRESDAGNEDDGGEGGTRMRGGVRQPLVGAHASSRARTPSLPRTAGGAGVNRRHTRRNAQDGHRGARRGAAEHRTAISRPQPHPTQAPRPSPPPSRRQQRQQQSPQETQQHPHQRASCTPRQPSPRIRESTRCTASRCRERTSCSLERDTGSGTAWGKL